MYNGIGPVTMWAETSGTYLLVNFFLLLVSILLFKSEYLLMYGVTQLP